MQGTQETRAAYLGQEGTLEEEMATHSSIPAWEIPWTEQPGGLQSMGSQIETIKPPPSLGFSRQEHWSGLLNRFYL